MQKNTDIIIIGAGLTGLTLAYLLGSTKNVLLLEARDRLGGRIYTDRTEGGAPIEMGATWLAPQHTSLHDLLRKLELSVFKQQLGQRAFYEPFSTNPPQVVDLPAYQEPSYRIAGGTDTLIHALANKLESSQIRLNTPVTSIIRSGDTITVTSGDDQYTADKVVSTLPPRLLSASVDMHPSLPEDAIKIMDQTHTWMGESIKVGLRFNEAFWRSTSGTIFSNAGPITEMYEHSDAKDTSHALKGFFNGAYHSATPEERKKLSLDQLSRYFGDTVNENTEYVELVWPNESYTYTPYPKSVLPHQHNGHPIYQRSFMDGRLLIAGSETSSDFPGYMEGAVRSAFGVFERLNV